jgi:hypothetical protein
MLTAAENLEKTKILKEIAGLIGGMTVRQAFEQWQSANPKKFNRLCDCIHRLTRLDPSLPLTRH